MRRNDPDETRGRCLYRARANQRARREINLTRVKRGVTDDDFKCCDCEVNTLDIGEFYMVHCHVWNMWGAGRRMLCIGCLEDRVGRKLSPDDFMDAPVNTHPITKQSDRFRDRLGKL